MAGSDSLLPPEEQELLDKLSQALFKNSSVANETQNLFARMFPSFHFTSTDASPHIQSSIQNSKNSSSSNTSNTVNQKTEIKADLIVFVVDMFEF